jgi:hypothetical protein
VHPDDADQPGWAVPDQPPREPDTGDTPATPPQAPEATASPSAAWAEATATPTPAPPPDGAAGRRPRRAWILVLVAVLAGIVAVAIAGTVLFVTVTLPPFSAANDFVNDLADAKYRSAARQLCAADRRDADRAISTITRHFPGNDRITVNPLGVDRDGSEATVEYTVSAKSSSHSHTYKLRVRQEQGDWKPCPATPLR